MNKNIFIWASDLSNSTGEGLLGRTFLKDLKINKSIKVFIKTFESYYKIKLSEIDNVKNVKFNTINDSIFHKYLGPLTGIIYSWKYYLRGYKIIYLNYLPLWNLFPFLLLPPKTTLGPVTGSTFMGEKKFNLNLRNMIFPFLYLVNSLFIQIRFKKVIFSTNLLKKYFPRNKKYFFNYVVTFLNTKKINKYKKFDLIYYYRKHENKNNKSILEIIKILSKQGFKICTIGNKLNIKNIKNYGYVSNHEVKNILKISRSSISSAENLFSIFNIESLNNNLKVFFDLHLLKYNKPKYSAFLIPINFKKKINVKKFKTFIEKPINKKNDLKYEKRVLQLKKKFNFFINDYL